MFKLSQHDGRPSQNFRLRFRVDPSKEFTSWELVHLVQKTLLERTANGSGFHIWCAKAMSSSRGAELILSYERLTGGGLTCRSSEI